MIVRELIGTAQVPGGEELRLYSHGRDFMIVLDRNELMSTRLRNSEEELARQALARLPADARPYVMIGGYGMGFTLRAALAMAPTAQISVVELMPEIIAWARGPMAELTGDCLDDPRVELTMDDVADQIAGSFAEFDAILLDVDNGPDGLVRADNDRLYTRRGLAAAREALRPGGVLAIWSAAPDPRFTRMLEKARFAVEEVFVHARVNQEGKGKGAKHVIWFAKPV